MNYKSEINKLFDEFLNGLNSRFVELEIEGQEIINKTKKSKAIISRGNIGFLREQVLKKYSQSHGKVKA